MLAGQGAVRDLDIRVRGAADHQRLADAQRDDPRSVAVVDEERDALTLGKGMRAQRLRLGLRPFLLQRSLPVPPMAFMPRVAR